MYSSGTLVFPNEKIKYMKIVMSLEDAGLLSGARETAENEV